MSARYKAAIIGCGSIGRAHCDGYQLNEEVEIVAVADPLAVARGVVPPTINYETPDPECDLDYTANQPRELPVGLALSNSFGFGGTNACLALRRYQG